AARDAIARASGNLSMDWISDRSSRKGSPRERVARPRDRLRSRFRRSRVTILSCQRSADKMRLMCGTSYIPLIAASIANHDPTAFLEAASHLQHEECSNSQAPTSCLGRTNTLRLALRRNRIVHDEAGSEQPAIV